MNRDYRQEIFDLKYKIAITKDKVSLIKYKEELKNLKREYSLHLYNERKEEKTK